MSDWIPVVGTLLGTSLGAGAAMLGQHLQNRRVEASALRDLRRSIYANYLTSMHGLFLEVRQARQAVKLGESARNFHRDLMAIQPLSAQQGLDEVRLIGSESTVQAAETIFRHLRGASPDIERGSAWHEWHARYRDLRAEFLKNARTDFAMARRRSRWGEMRLRRASGPGAEPEQETA